MYNLNYNRQLWGYKVEDKLYLGVREQKRLNTTDLDYPASNKDLGASGLGLVEVLRWHLPGWIEESHGKP
jgi:hypothetical protein